MPLVGSVRSAFRKLLGRPLIDAKEIDDAKGRDAKYYAYTYKHVNVDRDFKKPRP